MKYKILALVICIGMIIQILLVCGDISPGAASIIVNNTQTSSTNPLDGGSNSAVQDDKYSDEAGL